MPVLFFDVDDCLYSRASKVQEASSALTDSYFEHRLGFGKEDTNRVRNKQRKKYGLIVEGLASNHQIDPLEYNSMVDDAIELESLIRPDSKLSRLLQDVDTSKVKLWLLTNAYVTHA
ncbi:hypothetical protein FHL15_005607 [Xylaria flabelliformis]|uniref:Pyrimidine 5'-nucleotidase n=1 Tax=Xylaria flabelliformis TaxID=2512241 RepID=A0A553I0C8_9PEZI|nr:hypothetical protein FHL15_005607 [Xylaria flabelliformis]